jgi:hypothetical protein
MRFVLTAELREFLRTAADAGIEHELAIRLGLDRALLLGDAGDLGLHVERARRILNVASCEPRASVALGEGQSAHLRRLYGGGAIFAEPLRGDALSVSLPEEILTLARGSVRQSALHAAAVEEMLAWERAARVGGRTMREWGLKTLALGLLNR